MAVSSPQVLISAVFASVACVLSVAPRALAPAATSAHLIQQQDLHYAGAYRLPRLPALQYGGQSAAFHDNRLLVKGFENVFYDFAVPTPRNTTVYAELPQAELIQQYDSGLDNGMRFDKNPRDTMVRGLLFVGPKLLMTIASYYDAANAQVTSHLVRDWQTGVVTVHALPPVGHTAGFMTLSHGELAPALTGNFGLPIITRESWGPAAFVFDPNDLSKPAVPVLDYPDNARSLGPWNGQSNVWNAVSMLGGMHQIGNSLLFVGVHGTGPFCYGGSECKDPEGLGQGTHSYPYTPRIWAYDTADLIAVKHGRKRTWEPRPYGLWNLTLPFTSGLTRIASAFDASTNRLFILQGFGDKDPAEGWPIVHVYNVAVD